MEKQTSIKGQVISLGKANFIDYAFQLILPIVLVRFLDPTEFGYYRLFWLIVNTVLAVALLGMPRSLFYFLPRSDPTNARLYINQTLIFLAVAGAIGALAISPLNPLMPRELYQLSAEAWVIPGFALLWVVASMLDILPTIEGQTSWQAKSIIGLAIARALSLSMVAALTQEVAWVFAALLGFVILKTALLLYYVKRRHGIGRPFFEKEKFKDQVHHAAPFGIATTLNSLRTQSDQWVAAALFSTSLFAAFSIATVLGPMVQVFRQTVNNVILPAMSKLHADTKIQAMLDLNNKGNVAIGLILYPVLVFFFVYTDAIITLVYTESYIAAAPVMRVYIIALVGLLMEISSISILLRQGNYSMAVNFVTLLISIPISFIGARTLGLAGAAAGSIVTVYLERFANLRRISYMTDTPIRKLQDWKSLLLIFGAALISGAVAWAVTRRFISEDAILLQLISGGLLLGLSYFILIWQLGYGSLMSNFLKRNKE